MSEWPTCTRPDGREYRPVKAPTAVLLHLAGDVDQVVVFRTHDVELAQRLAGEALTGAGYPGRPLGHTDCTWGKWRATGTDRAPGWSDEPSNPKATPAVFIDVLPRP